MTRNYANNLQEQEILAQALQWHLDNGVDEVLLDTPVDRTAVPDVAELMAKVPAVAPVSAPAALGDNASSASPQDIKGTASAVLEAQKLADSCQNLEELKKAISDFDGISLKKTATNMVFGEGVPNASIMVIGEAPGADEDRQGVAFVGPAGVLQDKILNAIGLDRQAEDVNKAVYMTNMLNWRPPGNRTLTKAEIDMSLPFIRKHIALVQPKLIILLGGVTGKTLLQSSDSISKMRGVFHDYISGDVTIPTIVTYPPLYLINTPSQKKAVWADMLMFQDKMKELGLF